MTKNKIHKGYILFNILDMTLTDFILCHPPICWIWSLRILLLHSVLCFLFIDQLFFFIFFFYFY